VIGRAWRVAAAGAAALVLAACATTPPPEADGPWTSGRLSLRVAEDGARAAQSLSAAFELAGDGERGQLNLSTPLGSRLASVRWSPEGARLTTPEGEQRFGSLDALARQALGEAVPLAALPDWLAGRPWARAPHEPRPDGFVQFGWQVHTNQRAEGRIEARRLQAPEVLLRVRLEP
jgi:outer membrane lipoprotein LolB